MTFRDDIKIKKDYFMKEYTRQEILETFKFIVKRMERTGEIEGKLEDIKIVQIEGNIITVETKMNDLDDIRLYKMSLEFTQMENKEFTREAKINSAERYGEIIELKKDINNEEKIKYFEEVTDCWSRTEEIEKRIQKQINTSNFIEKYGKENITKIIDIMIQNSVKSEELLGELLERKIVKIEDTTVSVAIKTKEDEKIRVYRLNVDFDKIKNMGYTNKAKIESPMRIGSAKELQNTINNEAKIKYYDELQDFWNRGKESAEKEDK